METATPDRVAAELNPVPGFCVKSRATNNAPIRLTASDQIPGLLAKQGQKIFVNIAWDSNVPPPPPPPTSDDAIHHATHALDTGGSNTAPFIPIVLSDARPDYDKAGQPAIVFDCALHPSMKSRALRDPEFKSLITELAFQQIEAQTALRLSRQITTPNIASKGKPRSRPVLVPSLYPHHRPTRTLVQEVPDRSTSESEKVPPDGITNVNFETRILRWSCTQRGSTIRVVFDVPEVTHSVISESTLDLEPRRVLLHIPGLYHLDLDLDVSDVELLSVLGENESGHEALKLKRMRSLDVDNARAEWRVADRAIVLLA